MNKTIGIWIAVFAGTFALLFVLIKTTAPKDTSHVYPETTVIRENDHVRGNPSAPGLLVEYGDFQCPGCAGFEPLLQQLSTELGDKMVLVYRYFPLPGHKHAIISSRYAEAAGMQGKFWEMHDRLFAEQQHWQGLDDPTSTFLQYAKDLGLDTDKLKRDADSESVAARISDSLAEAKQLELPGTPSFFVNGRLVHPQSYDELKALIENSPGR